MKRSSVSRFVLSPCCLLFGQLCFSETVILDQFDDGSLGVNTYGAGSGFGSTISGGSIGWQEADSVISHTGGTTNAALTGRLYSLDSFVANSADEEQLLTATFVMTDWHREVDTTNWNGRFGLGITIPSTVHVGTAPNSLDGFWVLMNFDGNGLEAGQGGLAYVDSGISTRVGESWEWDDNGVDVEGATAIEIATSTINTAREDRVDIDMIAPDIEITVKLGADFWAVEFSSSDPTVVLPEAQTGTFSELGLTNDLSEAVISSYHQGDNLHTAVFDSITVDEGAPTDFSFGLAISPTDVGYQLEWESQESYRYNVYSSETLTGSLSTWDLLESDFEAGAGLTSTLEVQPGSAQQFFRVQELPPLPIVLLAENFDEASALPTGWTIGANAADTGTTTWQVGSPSVVEPLAAVTEPNCVGTNLASNYGFSTDIWLRTPEMDLATAVSATLSFDHYFDIEDGFDDAAIRVLRASDGIQLGADVVTSLAGISEDWESASYVLPQEALGEEVVIEFVFTSDTEVNYAGWYLDNVQVEVTSN